MTALKTAMEIALESAKGHPIPAMTHPYGQHWDQPSRFVIEIDATHAMMDQATFEKLATYSCSIPSGVYEGKMWKCRIGDHLPRVKEKNKYWVLRWFGPSDDPQKCSINSRKILIV